MNHVGRCRLAVVASHPVQYFTPLYRRLAQQPGIDLQVFFCRDFGVRSRYDRQFARTIRWDMDQLSGYAHRFLTNVSPIRDPFNPLHAINPGVFAEVLRGFDALWVNGYMYPSNWLALAAAAARGTRLLMRSELWQLPRQRRTATQVVRDSVIRWWVRRADALLYIGQRNREAYLAYGALEEQLFFTPYSVDVDRLEAASRLGRSQRAALRSSLGIPPHAVVMLFVGKMTPRKHPEALIRLLEAPQAGPNVHVVFAGSGPLEADIRRELGPRYASRATFLGFVNQSALADVYAAADVFVMPSEGEPWGLVLNEAMAAGLPPVVSDAVGSVPDLITAGVTGYTFASGDWAQMATLASALATNPVLRAQIGTAAQARARAYSYEATVDGIVRALVGVGCSVGTSDDTSLASAPARARATADR